MTLDKRLDDSAPHQAKLTARDFWLLADSGAFANHARTELIEGEIWVVNSVHRWHARAMVSLSVALMEAIKAQAYRWRCCRQAVFRCRTTRCPSRICR
jgi:hypothetical protein